MKAKRLWLAAIIAVLVLALLITGILVHNWWHSPGVHVIGNRAHIEIKRNAYMFNPTSGEILGTTDVVLIGEIKGRDFEGYMSVEGYHISLQELDDPVQLGEISSDHLKIIYGAEPNQGLPVENGEFVANNPIQLEDFPYQYEIILNRDNPESFWIDVTRCGTGYYCWVISAESEEAALQQYHEYYAENFS